MKWIFATIAVLMLAGCGDFEWFPDPIPTITSFTPTSGPQGTAVTINGTNFSTTPSKNTVRFNGTTAAVTNSTLTQIVAIVPAGATTGPITVKVGSETATSATNFTVTLQVSTLAGTAGIAGSTDGTGTAASFSVPIGITTDGTNLYVADSANSTIRTIAISTGAVSTLAGTAGVLGSNDGTGATASFTLPSGITTDGTNLYVTDALNNTVRKIVIATGEVTTLAGTADVFGSDDGIGAAASFDSPKGITTDGINLYLSDNTNNTIRKIVIATGEVTTLAGTAGIIGSDNGIGAAASFNAPEGITTDGINLYISDSNNNTIRKIVIATGEVTTLAGTTGIAGSTDGTGVAASFNFPVGITTDGTNLYVVDSFNFTIRKIVIASGTVTTIAGTAGVLGSDDGTAAAASFNAPEGITTAGINLYVSDTGNHTIRKIQ